MRDSFIRALTDLAGEDRNVMLISGDLGFGVLDDFIARWVNRVLRRSGEQLPLGPPTLVGPPIPVPALTTGSQ